MSSPFHFIPRDPETTILEEALYALQGCDVLHQVWIWDGMRAESLVFRTSDLAELTECEMRRVLHQSGLLAVSEPITYATSTNGFTFISYNFQELKPLEYADSACGNHELS